MMPASTTAAVSVILYAWFATFGFILGLVVALVCFHLAPNILPVEGPQDKPEEGGLQEMPVVRVASMQQAAMRWTIFGEDADLLAPRPLALRRRGVEVLPSWPGSLGDCREIDSTSRVGVGRNLTGKVTRTPEKQA